MSNIDCINVVQFEHLFSGVGTWSVQLVDDVNNQVLAEQTCLPIELSKLLIWNGPEMFSGMLVNNRIFSIKQIVTSPDLHQTSIHLSAHNTETPTDILYTSAQKVMRKGLVQQLNVPVNYAHIFVQLNEYVFFRDPAHLIVTEGKNQYDEYTYLVEEILIRLMGGEHPEYAFRTVFEDAELIDRVSADAVQDTMDAIYRILDHLAKYPVQDPELLRENPIVFICAQLLQSDFQRINPFITTPPDEYRNASVLLARAVLNGVGIEPATIEAFLSIGPECNLDFVPHDERHYVLNAVETTISSLHSLLRTSACKRLVNQHKSDH